LKNLLWKICYKRKDRRGKRTQKATTAITQLKTIIIMIHTARYMTIVVGVQNLIERGEKNG
jgi:hypothetical protein